MRSTWHLDDRRIKTRQSQELFIQSIPYFASKKSDEGSGCTATERGKMTFLSNEVFSRNVSTKTYFNLRFSHRQDNACAIMHMISSLKRTRRMSLNASPLSTGVFPVQKETYVWLIVSDNS
jgi:hypothetical protein